VGVDVDMGADVDVDADTDADTDANADTYANAKLDIDADVNADMDAETDAETDAEMNADMFPLPPHHVIVSASVILCLILIKIVLKIYENSCIPSSFYLCCTSFFRFFTARKFLFYPWSLNMVSFFRC
jgi:hypothetical protein